MTDRITFNPKIMGGQPCIRGLRMPVSIVVKLAAQGLTFEQILDHYPDLQLEDIKASLDYAAMMTEGRIVEIRKTG